MPYRYSTFEREMMAEDASFSGGPAPGEPLPDFDLRTVDGGNLRKEDFLGGKPLVLSLVSITCPMTTTAVPILKRLHRELGGRLAFASLYVREAHPGERFPQPRTFKRKLEHARAWQEREHIPWPVAVDDIQGKLHRQLDPKPNSIYVMGPGGDVLARILWANDARALRRVLHAVAGGRRAPFPEREARLLPMLRGAGAMHETLALAGTEAQRDFRRAAPPIYGLATLATVFRPLPPLGRTFAAAGTIVALAVGLTLLGRALYEREQRPRRRFDVRRLRAGGC